MRLVAVQTAARFPLPVFKFSFIGRKDADHRRAGGNADPALGGARVEPLTHRQEAIQLDAAVDRHILFRPPDPGRDASQNKGLSGQRLWQFFSF